MKRVLPATFVGWFLNYARKLEHPQLFKWMALLFLVDLLIPDLVPFVDEILLGLGTLLLASWKKRRAPDTHEKTVKGMTSSMHKNPSGDSSGSGADNKQ